MRKRLYAMMSLYTKITTGILFVAAVYISVFYGWEEELGVEILWQILGLAGACTLGSLLLPADGEQEVSKKSMLARIVGYYVYVNVIVLLCGFLFGWFSFGNWKQVLGMVMAIAFVYLTIGVISSWLGHREAERMNQKLEGRKRS